MLPSQADRPDDSANRRNSLFVVLALMVAAAAIRLPTLSEQSFWLDEAFTEHLVRMPLSGMFHTIPLSESTPPLYYVLAWGWVRLFGHSEFGLRSLSALAGTLTVPVSYAIGCRLGGRRSGLIAGLLVALAPIMVWFSQEARSYALASLLGSVTVLCVVAYGQGRDPRWLTGWAVSSCLGLATHYFIAFLVAPELAWLLWTRRHDRRVLAASGAVVAMAAALTPLALRQRGTGHADYISHGSLATRLVQIPKQFLTGYASPGQVLTTVLAAALVAAVLARALHAGGSRTWLAIRTPLMIGLVCVLVPVVLAIAGVDFVNTRNLLVALPPLLVVVAIATARSGAIGSATVAGGLAAIFIAVVALVDANPRFQRDNWRGASDAIGAPRGNREVLVSPASGSLPLGLYQRRLRPLGGGARVSELDVVALPVRAVGGGVGAPPRPTNPSTAAPGFRLQRATYTRTYTVLRYTSIAPEASAPTTIAWIQPPGGPFARLIQVP
jgi:uncharacterized membrane protein